MNLLVSNTFDKTEAAYKSERYRYIINSGGSRSGKTYSTIQLFITLLLTKKNFKISCYRNLRVDCIDTVMQDAENIINSDRWLQSKFKKNKKDATYTCETTGSVIVFAGTEKIHKALGSQNDIIFLNEISEFSQDVFNQLDQRCRGHVFIDYNPSKEFWVEKYRENDTATFIHSTYKDNIQFLTAGIIAKLESYNPYFPGSTEVIWKTGKGTLVYKGEPITRKNQPPEHPVNVKNGTADRYMYEVYCLGLGSEKPNRIYKNWKVCSNKYYDNLEYKTYFGLDFGIIKPTALVEVKYDGDKTFYVDQRLYRPSSTFGVTTSGYLKTVLNPPLDGNDLLVADSAKHTQVDDLRNDGLLAVDAIKGPGSIMKGIEQLQGFTIYTTKRSNDLRKEYMEYSYKMDRYGLVTDEVDPVSEDHLLDATRYIISYLIRYLGITT